MLFIFSLVEAVELRMLAKLADVHTCLRTRWNSITGKKCYNPPHTSILSHHRDKNHPVSFEDFKILSSSSFEYDLLLHESLLISKLKPSLNANIGSASLSLL